MSQMDLDDERSLVARLRAGDTGAFDDVYEAYRPRVFSFLLRMSRSRTVAEDLLDETWLRLVRSAHDLRPDTRIGPWLFTVARNLYWSYRRTLLVAGNVGPRAAGALAVSDTLAIAVRSRGRRRARASRRNRARYAVAAPSRGASARRPRRIDAWRGGGRVRSHCGSISATALARARGADGATRKDARLRPAEEIWNMTVDDDPNDPVLASLATLRTRDVHERRADRLRARCHALLRARPRRNARAGMVNGSSFRRLIAPALGGAWCLAYVVEIIRRAAAVYGF